MICSDDDDEDGGNDDVQTDDEEDDDYTGSLHINDVRICQIALFFSLTVNLSNPLNQYSAMAVCSENVPQLHERENRTF